MTFARFIRADGVLMTTESFGTELIERHLRTRKLRYFRGHHDGEFFFILTVGQDRLHVHLEIDPADRETFTIRVTHPYFFPAADRARLRKFADSWNLESRRVKAVVQESCDPNRIAVVAETSYPIMRDMPFEEFAGLADNTIRSAVKLFAEMTPPAEPTPTRTLGTWLKDAG